MATSVTQTAACIFFLTWFKTHIRFQQISKKIVCMSFSTSCCNCYDVYEVLNVTLRLVLERWWLRWLNLHPSIPGVSALPWTSAVSELPPPDMGKIPKDRGRSFLFNNKNRMQDYFYHLLFTCQSHLKYNLHFLYFMSGLIQTNEERTYLSICREFFSCGLCMDWRLFSV